MTAAQRQSDNRVTSRVTKDWVEGAFGGQTEHSKATVLLAEIPAPSKGSRPADGNLGRKGRVRCSGPVTLARVARCVCSHQTHIFLLGAASKRSGSFSGKSPGPWASSVNKLPVSSSWAHGTGQLNNMCMSKTEIDSGLVLRADVITSLLFPLCKNHIKAAFMNLGYHVQRLQPAPRLDLRDQ